MSADEFTKLFSYMTKRFDRIEQVLDTKARQADMDRTIGLLDSLAKRQDKVDSERVVVEHQIERLNGWTHELAAQAGHNLSA